MRRETLLGLLVFLVMYTPSSSSCTSSSTRWPRELIWPRGFTLPARSRTTSEERLVLGSNTTSPTFPGGTSMWMSSPERAVLCSSLTGRNNQNVLLDILDSLLFLIYFQCTDLNLITVSFLMHIIHSFSKSIPSHALRSKWACYFTFQRCWHSCERKDREDIFF